MSAPDLIIRDARPDERLAASDVIRAAYAEFEPVFSAERWPWLIKRFSDVWYNAAAFELIVALDGGRVIATAQFHPNAAKSEQGVWPERAAAILRLAVHPDRQRRGVAKQLVNECIARCRARAIPTLALHSANWMPVARGMYERMGFARVPEIDFHPSPETVGYGYRFDL